MALKSPATRLAIQASLIADLGFTDRPLQALFLPGALQWRLSPRRGQHVHSDFDKLPPL
jgi:hypothetical protein